MMRWALLLVCSVALCADFEFTEDGNLVINGYSSETQDIFFNGNNVLEQVSTLQQEARRLRRSAYRMAKASHNAVQHILGSSITSAYILRTADFNNDSIPDFVAGGQAGVAILMSKPDSSATYSYTTSWYDTISASSLAIGDVNQDGLPDVVAGTFGGRFMALLNSPTFQFEIQTLIEDVSLRPRSIVVLEQPSSTTILSSSSQGSELVNISLILFPNVQGPASLEYLTTGKGQTFSITTLRINGELQLAYAPESKISLMHLTTNIITNVSSLPGRHYLARLRPSEADVDTDMLVSASFESGFVWLHRVEQGAWTSTPLQPASKVTCVVVADLDGDGLEDIVYSSLETHAIMWLRNGGSAFEAMFPLAFLDNVQEVVAADVNQDGMLDVVGVSYETAGSGSGSSVVAYINDGNFAKIPALEDL